MLVACIVNVFGDLFLVAGLHLDAAGAAIATVAAQAVSVVCAVIMLLKKHLPFKLCKADFRLNPQCRKFLSIGLPLALQEFLTQLSFLALCAFVNRLSRRISVQAAKNVPDSPCSPALASASPLAAPCS